MRLELRTRTELALRTLQTLADGRRRRAAEIAERVDSTPAYIAHVMVDLNRPGWTEATPGPTGGHRLAVDLSSISLLALIEAIEGATDDGRCVMADRACPSPDLCALHDAWIPARDALTAQLAGTTLDTVIDHQEVTS